MAVGPNDLAPWFRGRSRLVVAKGKKHQEHTLRGLSADDRAKLVLGPSGKLRAPTLLVTRPRTVPVSCARMSCGNSPKSAALKRNTTMRWDLRSANASIAIGPF